MSTKHRVIFGNCMSMEELPDNYCHLMVTSPPYFNAPFDYEGFFKSYDTFLTMIEKFATETYRVLQEGRVAVVNVDDMLINGEKYPIIADTIKIFQKSGFRYRDKIVWKKPDGYLRISKRSGVLLQNPFPMYFYPDNLLESILIFQKGKFDYRNIKKEIKEKSRVDKEEFQKNKWYMTLWEMTNVLPGSRLEKNIAAFPDELPYRFIKLFSYKGEIILDPFLGSGTTMKVARKLERNSIGFEINRDLETVIREKAGFINADNIKEGDTFEVSERSEGKYRYINYEIIEEIKNKNN